MQAKSFPAAASLYESAWNSHGVGFGPEATLRSQLRRILAGRRSRADVASRQLPNYLLEHAEGNQQSDLDRAYSGGNERDAETGPARGYGLRSLSIGDAQLRRSLMQKR